jgi:hypothetical protein
MDGFWKNRSERHEFTVRPAIPGFRALLIPSRAQRQRDDDFECHDRYRQPVSLNRDISMAPKMTIPVGPEKNWSFVTV